MVKIEFMNGLVQEQSQLAKQVLCSLQNAIKEAGGTGGGL